MARSKKSGFTNGLEAKGRTPSPESDRPIGPLSVVPQQVRDVVKVNHYNTTELRNACDDALKRVRTLAFSKLVRLHQVF
jgi:signal peptidase complex subunit 2